MSDRSLRGLASIIVPCWNQLEFTRQCVASLRQHTRDPWELIAIDNGSTDGTGHYLAGVRDMSAVPVTVITNAANLGFPAAINQGLREARGEYLVLLNNDVVVTDGWLDQLVALANARAGRVVEEGVTGDGRPSVGGGAGSGDPRPTVDGASVAGPSAELVCGCSGASPPDPPSGRGGTPAESCGPFGIGLVGPMSNYAAPPQLVDGVPYRELDEMPAFARRWRDEHLGQWFTVPKLSGFCLLMKRAVYDKVGGLDERFGLGFFDDDDLAERARRAGFELAVAYDLFVHHFGSRTFAGNGIDARKILAENAGRFAAKWGLRGSNGRRVTLQPWAAHPEPQRDGNGRLYSRGEENLTQSRKAAKNSNGPVSRSNGGLSFEARTDDPPPEWGSSAPILNSPFAPLRLCVRSSSSSGRADAARSGDRARVSLTMIVRNEEMNLSACLQSVRGVFDEIIVVDTGSTDRTVEIARSFGARVFDFPWIDDFAAARNEALSHATGDYVFWLDADDVVEPDEIDKLRALLATLTRPAVVTGEQGNEGGSPSPALRAPSPHGGEGDVGCRPAGLWTDGIEGGSPSPALRAPSPRGGEGDVGCRPAGLWTDGIEGGSPSPALRPAASSVEWAPSPRGGEGERNARAQGFGQAAAYVVRCACDPSPDGTGGETVVDHIRLFPLRHDVRWTYRVHEQILPALRRAGVSVRWTDLTVRHTGYVDRALRDRKLERDTKILKRELEDRPDDPFILFNLGAIAIERRDWHEALRFLDRSLAGSAPTDSIVRKIFALMARAHQMLDDSQAALQTCARGLQLDPGDAELWFRKAVVHRHRGESSEAEQSWRRILSLRRPDQFCSVDQGIYGHLTRRNLAALAAERGDHAEVERLWNDVLAECPGDREAVTKLERLRATMSVARENQSFLAPRILSRGIV